jgi:hypothetical protein
MVSTEKYVRSIISEDSLVRSLWLHATASVACLLFLCSHRRSAVASKLLSDGISIIEVWAHTLCNMTGLFRWNRPLLFIGRHNLLIPLPLMYPDNNQTILGSYPADSRLVSSSYDISFCFLLGWLQSTKAAVPYLRRLVADFPPPAARVRSHVRSCGVCGGQSGIGEGFLRVLRTGTISQIVADLPSGPSLTPRQET